MKKLLIIDGNSIINRAFYAIKALANKQGMFTNGIYGFLNILFKNTEELNPDYIAVAFDLKAPTFRHKMYDKYKAQRKGMPEELRMQMPVMKEILSAMNIAIFEKEGYEADDIIGTISRICDESDVECFILTGDKDDLQLASDKTKVLLTISRMGNTETNVMDKNAVFEKYGVTPQEFIDVKALMGDSSDNVPGVAGIGEKTAFAYIQKFKSIENLYDNLDDEIIKPAARNKLADGKDMAYLSKTLCTIDRFVPMDFDFEHTTVKPYDNERLATIFKNLEFNAFLKKIGGVVSEKTKKADYKIARLDSAADLNDKLASVKDKLVYRIYQASNSIYCFAFLLGDTVYYICTDLLTTDEEIAATLKPFFESDNITKVSGDVKADMVLLNNYGIKIWNNYFDTGVGGYIINPAKSTYSPSEICVEFLEYTIQSEEELLGTGKSKKTYDMLLDKVFEPYIKDEIGAIAELEKFELEKIKQQNQTELLEKIELPLVSVLADMEITGIKVDRQNLIEFNDMLSDKITTLENSIYELAGETFNINSTKQLGVILFEKLGLKAIKKTKTGYSTNSDVLEKLSGKHPIIDLIIEYRHIAKLKSTYTDGLLPLINPNTGRIYSKFNQTVTVTGRISSTEPNLQNIPVRTELGSEMRKMFVADEGKILVDADYSQIELRILAHMANDQKMIDAFTSGADIHTSTASAVFGVAPDEVTPLLRSRAKAVNFGIVYGMGDFSLSQDLHITKKEAKEYIDSYFEKYSSVRNYLDTTIADAKEKGYVSTLFERRRYLPELSSTNFMIRSFGERAAMNTPIQGSAADIIKIAMVSVYNELKKQSLPAKLILQVHDELIIETDEKYVNEVQTLLKTCMENAVSLLVPLTADTKSGKRWYDTK